MSLDDNQTKATDLLLNLRSLMESREMGHIIERLVTQNSR
jgi:hypothetical protein